MSTAKEYRDLLTRGPAGRGLETASGDNTGTAVKGELLDRLRAEIAHLEHETGIEVDKAEVSALLDQADAGLTRVFDDADLDDEARSGLEAVIRSDGSRPVLFVKDDFVDVAGPSVGDYAAILSNNEVAIRQVCRAVGRVDDPAAGLGYQGTAWMIAEGLVATNFHVLKAIAPGGVRKDGRFEGRINTGAAVHFGHELDRQLPERRFPIRRVVSVGREGAKQHAHPDDKSLNFDSLDLAILELEPVPGRPFPEPIGVARGDDPLTGGHRTTQGTQIYLVGYPGNPRSTTRDLFAEIFHKVKSFKRLAPGEILAVSDVPHDPRGWVQTHDASTLGGNSGSAVVDLESDGNTVLGLHFAGMHLRQNWAHTLERMTPDLSAVLPPIGR